MSIPLLLKIKQGPQDPCFVKSSDNIVDFQNRQYKFAAIYDNDIPPSNVDRLLGQTCALVLMGPTGSGKTTTLRNLLRHQILKPDVTHLTACEVSENRAFVDMVDSGKQKRFVSSLPMEKQLKKVELTEDSLEKLFTDRKTTATASNSHSSRSCLIVTLYCGRNAITIVDMMGNEKYDAARANSNVFANSNVSSITQMLLTRTTRIRSSNLVANLIFQKLSLSKIKVILHLDECGNPELIKSSLLNIVDVVKDFRVKPSTSVARSVSSSKLVPSYARPTVSSLSPRKNAGKSLRLARPRMEILTPTRNKLKPLRNLETPCLRKKPTSRMTESLYEVELKSLKEVNALLACTNEELSSQVESSKEAYASSILELKESIALMKSENLTVLAESLASIKAGYVDLEKENSTLLERADVRQSELERLQHANEESNSRITNLEEEKEATAAKLDQVNAKVVTLNADLAEKNVDLDQANLEIKTLKETHESELRQSDEQAGELKSLVERLGNSLEESQSIVETQKNLIAQLSSDKEKLSSDKEKLHTQLSELEQQIQKAKDQNESLAAKVSKQDELLQLETERADKLEATVAELKKEAKAHSTKLQSAQTEANKLKAQNEELTKKHTDLISYNKFIVEKYSTALDEKDKDKQDMADAQIKQLREESEKQQSEIDHLKEQLENLQMEASELSKYKAKCDNLETKAIELRDESIAQMSVQEAVISDLNDQIAALKEFETTNKELKRRLKEFRTPSPQKLPFNPSTDIFEDNSHRDYLKAFKQSMKATPSPKSSVLRESNIMSSDKKKLKRKASGHFGGTKSPKVAARA